MLRVCGGLLWGRGNRCLNQDLQDLGIFRIAGERLMDVERILFAPVERADYRGTMIRNALKRMMTVASLLEDGIELGFADGAKGLIPYSDLPEIGKRATLSTLELPNPYEMVLKTAQGATVEIPWDFARHYCDASYRPAVEAIAMRGRLTLGQRVRRLRNSAGLSQDALARAAGIGRVTLVRLEKGEHTPRYRTLSAVAKVLGVDVSELLVEREFLR